RTATAGVTGRVDFTGCRFEGRPRSSTILIGDKPITAAGVRFTHCEIGASAEAPIMLLSRRGNAASAMGGIRFNDCTIFDSQDRPPLAYRDDAGGVELREIT